MKKFKIVLMVMIVFLITGCASKVKDVKSIDNFKNSAEEKDLIASDNIENYTADYINEAMIATRDDLEIEMIVYDNDENASKIQESHIKAFMNMKSTGSIIKKNKGKNYYKFTMISNGYYLVTSRIDNTLVFTKTLLKNKYIVDSILDKMEY